MWNSDGVGDVEFDILISKLAIFLLPATQVSLLHASTLLKQYLLLIQENMNLVNCLLHLGHVDIYLLLK